MNKSALKRRDVTLNFISRANIESTQLTTGDDLVSTINTFVEPVVGDFKNVKIVVDNLSSGESTITTGISLNVSGTTTTATLSSLASTVPNGNVHLEVNYKNMDTVVSDTVIFNKASGQFDIDNGAITYNSINDLRVHNFTHDCLIGHEMFMKLVNEFDYEISARHKYAYNTTFNVDTFVNLQESFSPLNANMEYTATFECIPSIGTQLTKTHVFRTAGEHPEFTDISLMFLNANMSNVTSFDTTDIDNISLGWNSIIGTQTTTNDPIALSSFTLAGQANNDESEYIELTNGLIASIYGTAIDDSVGTLTGTKTIEFDFYGNGIGDGLLIAYTNANPTISHIFHISPIGGYAFTHTAFKDNTDSLLIMMNLKDGLLYYVNDTQGLSGTSELSIIKGNNIYNENWHTFKIVLTSSDDLTISVTKSGTETILLNGVAHTSINSNANRLILGAVSGGPKAMHRVKNIKIY